MAERAENPPQLRRRHDRFHLRIGYQSDERIGVVRGVRPQPLDPAEMARQQVAGRATSGGTIARGAVGARCACPRWAARPPACRSFSDPRIGPYRGEESCRLRPRRRQAVLFSVQDAAEEITRARFTRGAEDVVGIAFFDDAPMVHEDDA